MDCPKTSGDEVTSQGLYTSTSAHNLNVKIPTQLHEKNNKRQNKENVTDWVQYFFFKICFHHSQRKETELSVFCERRHMCFLSFPLLLFPSPRSPSETESEQAIFPVRSRHWSQAAVQKCPSGQQMVLMELTVVTHLGHSQQSAETTPCCKENLVPVGQAPKNTSWG